MAKMTIFGSPNIIVIVCHMYNDRHVSLLFSYLHLHKGSCVCGIHSHWALPMDGDDGLWLNIWLKCSFLLENPYLLSLEAISRACSGYPKGGSVLEVLS